MSKPIAPLPTMQHNALRILLNKRSFVAAEIARLDCRQLEKAPRIGKKGLQVIRAWLQQHGLDLDVAAAGADPQPEAEAEDDDAVADGLAVLNRLLFEAESRRGALRLVA